MEADIDISITFEEASAPKEAEMNRATSQRIRLERFLSSVQASGFRMAQLATSNTDDALELVQEAMLQLVKHYSNKPDQELKILFYRILSSRITDWYRKTVFRRQFHAFFSKESYEQGDPVQQLSDEHQLSISDEVGNSKEIELLMSALKQLSKRQHQCFLLRAWQGFDVKETAVIMKCSTGSVKTHYSRAIKSLRARLENIGPDKMNKILNEDTNKGGDL